MDTLSLTSSSCVENRMEVVDPNSKTKKRQRTDEAIQEVKMVVLCQLSSVHLPPEVYCNIYSILSFTDLFSLSLVNKSSPIMLTKLFVLMRDLKMNHCGEFLEQMARVIGYNIKNNKTLTVVEKNNLQVVASKIIELIFWNSPKLTRPNEIREAFIQKNLFIDSLYCVDPFYNYGVKGRDIEWFKEQGLQRFSKDYEKCDQKNIYKFLFFHIKNFSVSEEVFDYTYHIKQQLFTLINKCEEVNEITTPDQLKTRLMATRLAAIYLLECLDERALVLSEQKMNLPPGFDNLFFLTTVEKGIREKIFALFNHVDDTQRHEEEVFSYIWNAILLVYQKGEKNHALYIASCLSCFMEIYYELILKEFSVILPELIKIDGDYVFLLKTCKSICCPFGIKYINEREEEEPEEGQGYELDIMLETIFNNMLEKMSKEQFTVYLERIDWVGFFEAEELEQGVSNRFLDGVKGVLNDLGIEVTSLQSHANIEMEESI